MSRLVHTQISFLRLLQTTDKKQRIALIKTANTKQIRALCEIVLNVFKGIVPLSDYNIKKLVPFKRAIHFLVSKAVRINKKKSHLLRLQSILPVLLKAALVIIDHHVEGDDFNPKTEIRDFNEIDESGQDNNEIRESTN